MQTSRGEVSEPDEATFLELLGILWRGRIIVASATVLLAVVAGAASRLVKKSYEASAVVLPVTDNSTGGLGGALSSLGSQLGGVAALAGLSVGADSRKAESVAVLQSDDLTGKYIKQQDLLPVLYASKWDGPRKQWMVEPAKAPTPWMANQYFKKNVRRVSTDSKTGVLTLTIEWRNPALAAQWANGLIRLANQTLQDRVIAESERNIAYLQEQAAKTNVVEARQAIYAVLEAEVNKAMLARGTTEYAFKVLDPAVPPEKPSSPKLVVWVLMGLMGGFLGGCFLVLLRAVVRR